MPRKSRKGYYVDGEFVAEGSDADREYRLELHDPDAPSRTARKHASEELQDLGEALLTLRGDLFAGLPLPEKLRAAIVDAKRLTNFGAKRRQVRFVGKLIRKLEPEALEAAREALRIQNGESAKDTQLLHRAEHWRDALLADDDRLAAWLEQHPGTDAQQLRALIRQARKDVREAKPGEAPRQGRAYREIFKIVRAQLGPSVRPSEWE